MKTKIVSQLDQDGFLIGYVSAYESPLEPDVFLIPSGCIKELPPEPQPIENTIYKWNGLNWNVFPDYSGKNFFLKSNPFKTKQFDRGEEPNFSLYTNKEPLANEEFQVFDEAHNSWIVNPVKITFLRNRLKIKAKLTLESHISNYKGFVIVSGIKWDSGQRYLENINKTLQVKSKNPGISLPPWRDYNNQFHQVTETNLEEIRDAIELDIFNEGNRLYQRKWEIEAILDSIQDLELIEDFNVDFG